MPPEKEKGASPDQAAPQANDSADSTAPETPARFRGKGKRRTRADAIARKRGELGNARADLLAWLATLAVFALAGWLAGGVQ